MPNDVIDPNHFLSDLGRATEDDHVAEIFHSFAVDVELVTMLAGKAFDLFKNTAFGPVLLIKERRYHSNTRSYVHQPMCLSEGDDTPP